MKTVTNSNYGMIETDGTYFYASRNGVPLGRRDTQEEAEELLAKVDEMIPPPVTRPSEGDREIWLEAQDLAAQLEEKYLGKDYDGRDWIIVKALLFLLRTK